ncbi:MAG: hypothetical protein D6808_00185 [Candidatus Dadabacteria bacterium]|nr:MAG: hypothetical protein D6808_00185 [Candidatus Dadabacteria bacterium]
MQIQESPKYQLLKGVSRSAEETSGKAREASETKENKFEAMLRSLLKPDGANKVNEEELFAAILQERIKKLKGEDAAKKFSEFFNNNKAEMRRADGYVPVEDAARKALNQMVESGELSTDEGERIHAQAFKAAQLDDNKDALYDGRGSGSDPTIAVSDMEAALVSSRVMIEKFDSGEADAGKLALDGGSSALKAGVEVKASHGVDGPNGFVFKPVSESDGNLVILLPPKFSGRVKDIILKDEDGNKIEKGRSVGLTNGGRETYRYSKPGAEYPENLTVEVKLKNGKSKRYFIEHPADRYD